MLTHKRLPFILLIMLLLLAACQGAPVAETPTQPPAPTDPPAPTVAPAPAPVVLSAEELAGVTLTLDDLPAGFTVNEFNTGPITREKFVEDQLDNYLEYFDQAGEWTSYQASFERSGEDDMAFVTSWVVAFDSEEQAADFVEHYIDNFFSAIDYQPISFPQLGDQLLAYKATQDADRFTFDIYHVAFREKNVASTLQYTEMAGVLTDEQVADVARLLAERLHEALSQASGE